MPDLVTHTYFGEKVFNSLDDEIKKCITNKELYLFATAGPDPFFFYEFLKSKENKKVRNIGNRMHIENTKMFFINLIEEIKEADDKEILFSYLCGFITHFSLDSFIHPYIFHKTGIYDEDNPTDLTYRGLHTKLERAIDCYIIKKYYNRKPYSFKIYKEVLKLKKLPNEIYNNLDNVFYKTYGINNIAQIINQTVVDQRKFYKFIYDPFGIKNLIFKLIDKKNHGLDYTVLSYYGKQINDIDIFNKEKNIWRNPVNINIKSDDSVFELIDKAEDKCKKMIEASYKEIFINENNNYKDVFEYISYLSGQDLKVPQKMKYFNNIFK